jgi:hypothetical protein
MVSLYTPIAHRLRRRPRNFGGRGEARVGMCANKVTTAYHLIGTMYCARVFSSVHRTNWAF